MSLSGTSFEKKQKPLPPQGPQVALCYSIIDLGTHMKSFQGQEPKATPLLHISWEFPNLPKVVFNEGEQPKPYGIFQEYSTSMGDKAKLPKLLSAWRGVPCKDLATELPQFLGQPCLINVEYKQDKQRPDITYANVAMNGLGVMRLPAGTPVNPISNPKVFFNLDHYSHAQFAVLPKWIQKKIMSSLEWSGIVAKFGPPPADTETQFKSPEPLPTNTGFANQSAYQQQAMNTFGAPTATAAPTFTPPVNQFPTNVSIPAQQQASFGGEPIKGNPFETNDAPPF